MPTKHQKEIDLLNDPLPFKIVSERFLLILCVSVPACLYVHACMFIILNIQYQTHRDSDRAKHG